MGIVDSLERLTPGARERAESALELLRVEHEQVYENVDGDPHISDGRRTALVRQMSNADRRTANAVVDHYSGFCRAHQALGPQRASTRLRRLGHAVERRRFLHDLGSSANPASPVTLGRRGPDPARAADALLGRGLDDQRRRLHDVYLRTFQMFSFFVPFDRRTDPPDAMPTHEDIRTRLGLGTTPAGTEFLVWSHVLPEEESARYPTAFDAGLNAWFRPGGTTHPLDRRTGLAEVVHPPVRGRELASPIREGGTR